MYNVIKALYNQFISSCFRSVQDIYSENRVKCNNKKYVPFDLSCFSS